MKKDYYEILGIDRNASKDEVKRAYRRLAHEHHPDKGAKEAEQFKQINEAYEVLTDDIKRSQYDQFGQTFEQSAAGGGFGGFSGFTDFSDFMRGFGQNYSRGPFSGIEFDFGDIFSDIFGGPRKPRRERGVDLETTLEIDFLEAVFGVEKEVPFQRKEVCPHCQGSAAEPGTKIDSCPKCHGTGQMVEHRRTILGSFQQVRVCDRCDGSGKVPEKKCRACAGSGMSKVGKNVKVIIPPGIEDGQRLKLTGEGEVGYRGSKAGDLYLVIRVKPHPEFERDGFDIHSKVPISFFQAALGARIEVDTVDGKVMMKISPGTQSGEVLRLKGKGIPYLESAERGDHFVTLHVLTPMRLTKREKELLRQLAQERGESVDIDESLWGKIKKKL